MPRIPRGIKGKDNRKRARDYNDNPDIRRGRDAATVNLNERWEREYSGYTLKKKPKKK